MRKAVIGHSQLRHVQVRAPNVLKICKPGAKFYNFLDNNTIDRLVNFSPDTIIVVLGSNDIDTIRPRSNNLTRS